MEVHIYKKTNETRVLMEKGDFEKAKELNLKILERGNDNGTEPHDAALFNLGLIYSHYANPEKDYKKSNHYFKRLAEEHPNSPLSEEAKIWSNVFSVMEEITQITFHKIEKDAYAGLHFDQTLIRDGEFEKAKKKNLQILQHANGLQPGDAALYNLGLIHIHYANDEKDYRKATLYFTRLIEDFPNSPLVEEAKIWIALFDVIEKMDATIKEMHEAIEKMREVDVEIEEKKMELTQ